MSRGARIFLVISLVWGGLWIMGGMMFLRSGATLGKESAYLSLPPTGLTAGEAVRIEGTIAEGETVTAPFTRAPCVAALLTVVYVTHYTDVHDKPQSDSRGVASRRIGAKTIGIVTSAGRVEMPFVDFRPGNRWKSEWKALQTLPPELGITPQEIEAARSGGARGSFAHYSVTESTIVAGTKVFVAGKLASRDGALVLEPDPELKRIEVYAGTQAELVASMTSSGSGLRTAGFIFFGIAALPLLGLLISQLRSRRAA